ncbi:MAG: protein-glutamine glutaminase family protein [Bacteroidota bacterium]
MKRYTSPKPRKRLLTVLAIAALLSTAVIFDACNTRTCKDRNVAPEPVTTETATTTTKNVRHQTLTSVMTVANITTSAGASAEVIFNENTQFFTVTDAAALAALKSAFGNNKPVQITFDPWAGVIVKVAEPATADAAAYNARGIENGSATAMQINMATLKNDMVDVPVPEAIGILNTTSPGLTNVIPDFATAQMMFDYIAHQCCQLPGPYAIDYCIPFQYCMDGCYARAHKMCYIINKRYNYGTKKIFSFANTGVDRLCVQGQKWGGCCITWWYHVAPLVTVKTPTGPKSYVFDPAMFNQPVLLSVWLHAQENPSCVPTGKVPHVTMINIRPTASYAPSGMSGMSFSTDPSYSATNSTLNSYRYLQTCP